MIQHTLHQFHENDLFTSAAAMSYFGLMALFPTLLLPFRNQDKDRRRKPDVRACCRGLSRIKSSFCATLSDQDRQVGYGAIATCVVLVFWAGSWVFAVIERALNRIWGATSRTFWHGRALTLGMVGIVGLLLSSSVLVTSILVVLRDMASRLSPRQIERYPVLLSVGSAFWQIVFAALSYLITTVALFVVVYRFMPRAQVTPGRQSAGSVSRRAALGNCKVRVCAESELLPL